MKRAMIRGIPTLIIVLLCAGLQATGAAPARAQGAAEAPADSSMLAAVMAAAAAQGDTLTAAQADSMMAAAEQEVQEEESAGETPDIPTESLGLRPSFTSDTKTTDTRVELTNKLQLNLAYPSTWTVGGDIHFNRIFPRELSRESEDKGFTLNTGRQVLGKFPLRLDASRSYKKDEQNAGLSSYHRDVKEIDRLNFSISGGKRLTSWLSTNGSTGAGLGKLSNLSNKGVDRENQDLNHNLATHLDLEPIQGFKLVLGYSGQDIDTNASFNTISGRIQTNQDSLRLSVKYDRGDAFSLSFTSGQLDRSSETLDFERNQYGQVPDSTAVVIDNIIEQNLGSSAALEFSPGPFLEFTSSFSTSTEEKRLKIAQSRDRDIEKTNLQMQLRLKPWKGFDAHFSFKDNETHTVDFSADKVQNVSEFFLTGEQALNETFTLSGEAYYRLSQFVYSDGALDRDQAQNRYTGTVAGVPTPWLKASSTVGWIEEQDLQIPAAKSISSKDKNTLSWEGDLDFIFFKDYVVSQRYSVSVAEEDYFFTKDKNALNTEYILITSSEVPLGGRLSMDFEHEFRMRETGRYLPDPTAPGNPKTFFQDSRTKVEKLKLGMSYGYRSYLSVAVRPELGRDVKFSFSTKDTTVSPYGALEFAIKFTQSLAGKGNINLNLLHRSKFGSFVRENQRSLWLPTLNVSYTF